MYVNTYICYRAPKPVICTGACNHEVVFGHHYNQDEWDEFARKDKADRDKNVPGAGEIFHTFHTIYTQLTCLGLQVIVLFVNRRYQGEEAGGQKKAGIIICSICVSSILGQATSKEVPECRQTLYFIVFDSLTYVEYICLILHFSMKFCQCSAQL